ncbi:DNA-directed RNA polymerase subunit alpha, partial [Candidatus Falkowbacteria bacterium]
MSNISLPKKIKYIEGENKNEGKMVIEPCFPGYGVTLGNSLRRVILSSLPGAAVVGVKIKDVGHEFMVLPHLKEDILEFILNLKKIRLRVFSDEVVKIELKIHGKKDIKAGDITKNSQVEIVNPELVLGSITDMAGSLEAELFVKKGMGYEMIESRDEKIKEIGYIEMDSIYSP